ncbi:hypothetical protein Pcinc_038092 [Petrolisthes cinctipes]|uniref:Uncharacterized protein n=1 Tax=Petrolisthes cinctipes TaxID=88211 RepID=A0AAE1EKQ6_PETCI|nr:hypothetical protein Pcinc_038092 [Petrolisthes cinctipes]
MEGEGERERELVVVMEGEGEREGEVVVMMKEKGEREMVIMERRGGCGDGGCEGEENGGGGCGGDGGGEGDEYGGGWVVMEGERGKRAVVVVMMEGERGNKTVVVVVVMEGVRGREQWLW